MDYLSFFFVGFSKKPNLFYSLNGVVARIFFHRFPPVRIYLLRKKTTRTEGRNLRFMSGGTVYDSLKTETHEGFWPGKYVDQWSHLPHDPLLSQVLDPLRDDQLLDLLEPDLNDELLRGLLGHLNCLWGCLHGLLCRLNPDGSDPLHALLPTVHALLFPLYHFGSEPSRLLHTVQPLSFRCHLCRFGVHPLLSPLYHRKGSPAKLLLAKPHGRCNAIRSNQGESSGSGGKAGEERNGGGGDGNQGIGGGVGGGGQRECTGNEGRGSRGGNQGGGNRDDDDDEHGGRDGYRVDERRPMGQRPDRMAEILLLLVAEIIGTLESLDIHGLSARARILRVVSLGFTSVALVCLSASIGQRGTNPRLASILSWIGSVATFLGFISMIAMALLASFIA